MFIYELVIKMALKSSFITTREVIMVMISNSVLGQRLRVARQEAKYTLVQLAQKTGIQASSISEIERGQQTAYYWQMLEFSRVLGVSVGWFANEATMTIEEPEHSPTSSQLSLVEKLASLPEPVQAHIKNEVDLWFKQL